MKKNIVKVIALALLAISATHCAHKHHQWDDSPYFNTKFLANYDLVEQTLVKQSGFEQVSFPSTDGLMLNGLLLKRPDAKATIIFCAGFFPGRKEGQAPVVRMLPPEYNILLFDARGHGQSEGAFWSTLGEYGLHEYKDVLGALNFVKDTIGGPVVVYGICSGAFHASHALVKLSQEKKLQDYKIKGFVFDSGFASFLKVLDAGKYHVREKILPGFLSWYASKKIIRSTYLYKLTAFSFNTVRSNTFKTSCFAKRKKIRIANEPV